jgi:hypothetical protein
MAGRCPDELHAAQLGSPLPAAPAGRP